jgi:HTH-type transcriptional regulator / antitoxin HigA
MTDTQTNQYKPARVSPPGATIAELLSERDIPQVELATRLGMTPKFVNELIAGKVSLTPTTALALERALDVPADFWLARDARYQEAKTRAEALTDLAGDVGWLKELPITDMRKLGWIAPQPTKVADVAECMKFFGVAMVSAWREHYVRQTVDAAAYRASAKAKPNTGAVAAWLRAGELQAADVDCAPFNSTAFKAALDSARALTRVTDPGEFVPKLQSLFLACGVVVAFVPAPKGCPVSGAVRWLAPHKALVQLSLRYKTNDSLWFTFFHECGHIAMHGKKLLFLEDGHMASKEEDEADRFAADKLIPASVWARFDPFSITEEAIEDFAKVVGIAPGIVLGRLQKEGRVPWSRLNQLKVRYVWKNMRS